MRRLIFTLFVIAFALSACQPAAPAPTPTPAVTNLRFTFWGSEMEKAAIEQMVAAFETQNPDIDVEAIQIPYEEYIARVTSMMQNGEAPDVGYMSGLQAQLWARDGKLLDLTDIIANDPLLSTTLLATRYYYAPGKIAGLNTAVEATLLFYNKALFDEAGVPYPPADPAKAWTWDEFVSAAEKLTRDINGKHPGQDGFDAEKSALTARPSIKPTKAGRCTRSFSAMAGKWSTMKARVCCSIRPQPPKPCKNWRI